MKVLEYIHHLNLPQPESDLSIRVWASVEGITWSETERQRQSSQIEQTIMAGGTKEWVANQISQLPFCNAVEVVEGDSGVLVYPDWP